ncbi:hypothetical protein [Sphingomonas sp. TZW2008]|uniref:hypothetical protein n=1 Tax=Sphingomonas sp. TZW2008 TaxID=1917973 RepID=UPI001181BE31|nr:hypothetical protein [Sphingomonas sp. TZW2008]
MLDNLCAFGIFELEGHDRAVVHLQRDPGRWSLQGLHGPSNLAVSRELRGRAEAYLEQHGILIRRRLHAASKYDPVRRLSRYYSFADDED